MFIIEKALDKDIYRMVSEEQKVENYYNPTIREFNNDVNFWISIDSYGKEQSCSDFKLNFRSLNRPNKTEDFTIF